MDDDMNDRLSSYGVWSGPSYGDRKPLRWYGHDVLPRYSDETSELQKELSEIHNGAQKDREAAERLFNAISRKIAMLVADVREGNPDNLKIIVSIEKYKTFLEVLRLEYGVYAEEYDRKLNKAEADISEITKKHNKIKVVAKR